MPPKSAEFEPRVTLASLGLTALGGADAVIRGLTSDSRTVKEGTLFAALPGSRVHGAEYVQFVVPMGAVAILTDHKGYDIARDVLEGSNVAVVIAEDVRQTLARTAALWFGAQPETAVAVTGTNGKTSVTNFCRQIWELLDIPAVNLGTTGVEGAWTHPLQHTTPDPLTLHDVLAKAKQAGVTHVAMEASSHGLDQRRLDGVLVRVAGFTNFTQDHLDYHKTFEAYWEAKSMLFSQLLGDDGIAVVNVDDPKGVAAAEIAHGRGIETILVGRETNADLQLLAQRFDESGQDMRFSWGGQAYTVQLRLIGGFQAINVLVAAGMAIGSGEEPEEVFAVLSELRTVAGRMQLAATRENGATVYVDYAHTPDAVETAVRALRPHVLGRIVAIVGAGGNRDMQKRPLMGAAAAREADVVIVTDDNPRDEDPASIRAAVFAGALDSGGAATVIEVGDRAEAILRGVDMLGAGDALLICGKGHETGQVIGDRTIPFDDVEQASIAVAALEGGA